MNINSNEIANYNERFANIAPKHMELILTDYKTRVLFEVRVDIYKFFISILNNNMTLV
jgi:hypothetical protein